MKQMVALHPGRPRYRARLGRFGARHRGFRRKTKDEEHSVEMTPRPLHFSGSASLAIQGDADLVQLTPNCCSRPYHSANKRKYRVLSLAHIARTRRHHHALRRWMRRRVTGFAICATSTGSYEPGDRAILAISAWRGLRRRDSKRTRRRAAQSPSANTGRHRGSVFQGRFTRANLACYPGNSRGIDSLDRLMLDSCQRPLVRRRVASAGVVRFCGRGHDPNHARIKKA